ncbi:MAG TPA: acetamidase/formamidase family protein [Bryobacteraceae bacterium]|nr:acetamidase/formamidase family protein [Bryobacteraceae bacterium]
MQAQPAPRRIPRDQKQYAFSAAYPPVLTIQPGATVIVETDDARSGTIRTPADLLDRPHPQGPNPVTGPIYVSGAEPGDSLAVTVHEIALAPQGFTAVKARIGLLAERAPEYATKIIPIRNSEVCFSDKIRFAVSPMVGTIGVAPESGEIACLYPGTHGGNMDNKYVRPGCVLHLPVRVPGALLSLGDVHAAMGDGEVTMIGLEIAAEVTITVNLAKGETLARPWIEFGELWITTGEDMDTNRALRIACDEMVSLLMRRLGISFEEAYMLASVRADLAICQSCDPGRFPVTTRMVYAR